MSLWMIAFIYLLIFCTDDEDASGERSTWGCENSEEAAEISRAALGQVGNQGDADELQAVTSSV